MFSCIPPGRRRNAKRVLLLFLRLHVTTHRAGKSLRPSAYPPKKKFRHCCNKMGFLLLRFCIYKRLTTRACVHYPRKCMLRWVASPHLLLQREAGGRNGAILLRRGGSPYPRTNKEGKERERVHCQEWKNSSVYRKKHEEEYQSSKANVVLPSILFANLALGHDRCGLSTHALQLLAKRPKKRVSPLGFPPPP